MARKGLVVVRYAGCKLEVLGSCKVAGSYGFVGLTMKRDRVTIRDSNDLYATLPFGAVNLEGKLKQSGELNVDMTVVGRFEASRPAARQDELVGACGGATHLVTALTTGAFRFSAGAAAEVSGKASAFGAGTGGASSSSTEILNEDGNTASCAGGDSTTKAPPAGCASLMRLDIVAIGEEMLCPPKMEWKGKKCVASPKCPRGTTASFGVCAQTGSNATLSAECETGSLAVCESECAAKNAESCAEIGWRYLGFLGTSVDEAKFAAFSRKGCDLGSARGCYYLANGYYAGGAVLGSDAKKGAALLSQSCQAGWAQACAQLGDRYLSGSDGPKDVAKGTALIRQACDARAARACETLGSLLEEGTPEQAKEANEVYRTSCKLNHVAACARLGSLYAFGSKGTPVDFDAAAKFYRQACDSGMPKGCTGLGYLMNKKEAAAAVPQDAEAASRLLAQSCNADEALGCLLLARAYESGKGVSKDVKRATTLSRKGCDLGSSAACEYLNKVMSGTSP